MMAKVRQMVFFLSLAIAWMLCPQMAFADFPLASSGKAQTEIVIGAEPHPCIALAASELQHWVREISGATLPIVETAGNETASHIYLAISPEAFAADVEALGESDGFAVRPLGSDIWLFGNCPRAVLLGVYRLLFRNTDIIWARPTATFFTPDPNLALTDFDFRELPTLERRGTSMALLVDGELEINGLWELHNGCNVICPVASLTPRNPYREWMAKYDGWMYAFEGHPLMWQFLNPAKYAQEHPEYYALVKGQRVFDRHPCYSNPEMFETFKKELAEELAKVPDFVKRFNLSEADRNDGYCECELCRQEIVLEDGTRAVPTPGTNYFRFLNKAAAVLNELRPGACFVCHAYFATEHAPQIPIAENILPDYCPIWQNMKYPLSDPEHNSHSHDCVTSWSSTKNGITLFSYYGLAPAYPRPTDRTMIGDVNFIMKNMRFRGITIMIHPETGPHGRPDAWDFNAMSYWVMMNSCWALPETADAMREIFLRRVFGPAADDMSRFYALTEEFYRSSPGASTFQDTADTLWEQCVFKPGLTDACIEALENARAKVDDDLRKQWISRMIDTIKLNKEISSYQVYAVKADRVDFDPDFATGAWADAPKANRFSTKYDGQGVVSSLHDSDKYFAKFLYDDENLYAAFRMEADKDYNPSGEVLERDKMRSPTYSVLLQVASSKSVPREVWVDVNGNYSDMIYQDPWDKWNAEGIKIDNQVSGKVWSLMITIPLKSFAIDIQADDTTLRFEIDRNYTLSMAHGDPVGWPHLNFIEK
ncbi:MAG: DUF4838 domain-containing protein [Victivallales bacterium]|nr:DUF4838 domain-containing protein [Victivallales bacterium]